MECTLNHGSKVAEIRLSRSNLLSMLHKLDHMGDSALTICRQLDDDWVLVFRGERDEDHYEGRERGRMHPLTEGYLDGR